MMVVAERVVRYFKQMGGLMKATPGYAQTDVGMFPKDWEVKSFGRLFAFSNGVNADKSSYGKGLPFINVLEPITYSHIRGPEIPGRVSLPASSRGPTPSEKVMWYSIAHPKPTPSLDWRPRISEPSKSSSVVS